MRRLRLGMVLACLLLLCGCAAAPHPVPVEDAGVCTLSFITIGKGDCFLLTTPQTRHYLIDTGKAEDYALIARTLREKDVQTLDGIFLSHGHKDHAGGLRPLLEAFPTKEVFVSAEDPVSYTEIDPWTIAPACGATLTELHCGDSLDLGGVTAEVWLPSAPDFDNANNNSMVLRLLHGNNAFLLLGDTELEEEAQLLASGVPLEAQVLKLGHHGETDATSPALLRRVQPEIALITGNAQENPDSVNDTIKSRLDAENIRAYYSQGAVLDLISDGTTLRRERMKPRTLPRTLTLSLAEVDRRHECVTVRNDGQDTAHLEGCTLISQRGDEIFRFPKEAILPPGESLRVVTQSSDVQGDFLWPEESVWKKHRDTALLYDTHMNLLAADGKDLSSVPAGSLEGQMEAHGGNI